MPRSLCIDYTVNFVTTILKSSVLLSHIQHTMQSENRLNKPILLCKLLLTIHKSLDASISFKIPIVSVRYKLLCTVESRVHSLDEVIQIMLGDEKNNAKVDILSQSTGLFIMLDLIGIPAGHRYANSRMNICALTVS